MPFLVLGNKCDVKCAVSEERLRGALGIFDRTPRGTGVSSNDPTEYADAKHRFGGIRVGGGTSNSNTERKRTRGNSTNEIYRCDGS